MQIEFFRMVFKNLLLHNNDVPELFSNAGCSLVISLSFFNNPQVRFPFLCHDDR